MQVQITHQPSYAVATVTLGPGEQLKAESGAMIAMSPDTGVEAGMQGGAGKALKRAVLGGESFFQTTFTAGPSGGWVQVGPDLPGDINVIEMPGGTYFVQSGSFLASTPTIELDTKWGGAKSLFGGEGLFLLRCSGAGTLLVSSYGAIDRFTLQPGQSLVVDSGHIVAFQESVQYRPRKVAGWKATLLSGEGIVVDLTGPGEVLTQTRSQQNLISFIQKVVPGGSGSSGTGGGGIGSLFSG